MIEEQNMCIGVKVMLYDLLIVQFLFEIVEIQLDYYFLILRVFEGLSFRNVIYIYDILYMKKRKKLIIDKYMMDSDN